MTNQEDDTNSLAAVLSRSVPNVMTERDRLSMTALLETSWRIAPPHRSWLVRLSRFCVVGGLGTLVNTLTLCVLFQGARLPLMVAAIMAAEVAIITNFCLNDRWTFRRARFSLGRLGQFHLIALGGLSINVLILWLLVGHSALPYWQVNLLGIAVAMVWNFAANSLWTWGGVA